VPQGTDDIIDVAAMNFTIPILINPPAKVKRQTLIHTILNEIKKLKGNQSLDWVEDNPMPNKQWVILTFENLKLQVRIEGDRATILNKSGGLTDDNGNLLSWETLLKPFGELSPGISNIRLRRGADPADPNNDIVAIITELDTEHPNVAFINVDQDSLPNASLSAINAIINPTRVAPGKNLPASATGQRYLVLEDVPNNNYWGVVSAKANDVIEYNGSHWTTSFDSSSNTDAIVLNTTTNLLYEWRAGQWISVFEGTYQNGWWRLYL